MRTNISKVPLKGRPSSFCKSLNVPKEATNLFKSLDPDVFIKLSFLNALFLLNDSLYQGLEHLTQG
ncbi:hypothetical protein AB834_03060 [PVC group bacterium (ex Bugula neritina AB1)]|nr:hypothetical protein AB834_03060 [PVC group bacterium (ex Bugula neritina AB1)]